MKLVINFYTRTKRYVPVAIKVYIKIVISKIILNWHLSKLILEKNLITKKNFQKGSSNNKSILFIVQLSPYGGVETAFFSLLEGLSKKGFRICVAVDGTINYERVAKILKRSGIESFDLTANSSGLIERTFRLAKLLDLAAYSRLDSLFISNSIFGYQLVPMFKTLNKKIQILDWIHNQESPFIKYSLDLKEKIDTTIVVNKLMKKILSRKAGRLHRIIVVHNGTLPSNTKSPVLAKVVTFVGRLEKDKRPDIFIEIAKRIFNKDGEVKFEIIGDGSMRKQLESRVKRDKIERKVKFFGFQKNVLKFLRRSSLLIITSPVEGSPLILLEAMAAGVPVVSSRVGGIPEVLRHGEDGYLVNFGDVEKYLLFSLKILNNKGLARKMGANASKRIEKNFTLDIFVKRMTSVLDRS